jgi:hypothetical protein
MLKTAAHSVYVKSHRLTSLGKYQTRPGMSSPTPLTIYKLDCLKEFSVYELGFRRIVWDTVTLSLTCLFDPRVIAGVSRTIVNSAEPTVGDVAVSDEQLSSQALAVDGLNNMIGMNGLEPNQPNERYKAISLQAIDKVAEDHPQLKPHLEDVRLAGLVFPFKASPYYVDELIDWEAENVRDDPFYRLVFPTMDMLKEDHREKLVAAKTAGDPAKIMKAVAEIREDLNPHPAGQKTLNTPKNDALTGVQHKYSETVLIFPAAAQTCHAYCTYCFRWAQFIGDDEL